MAIWLALTAKCMATWASKLDKFIHFTLSEESAIERLSLRSYCEKCFTTYHSLYKKEQKPGFCDNDGVKLVSRIDDQPLQIKKRMQQYREHISPILEHFRKQDLLLEIDAAPSIEEIHKEIVTKLGLEKRN